MSDALCGPSNALQNFQKHASVDRTLQQDRLISRQSPSQGFRSQSRSEGILDPEFAAFEANLAGPPLPDIQHAGSFAAHTPQLPIHSHAENPGWAADFQRLQISGHPQPIHQHQGPSVAPVSAIQEQGWHAEFLKQQQQQQTPMQHHQPYVPGFQPSFASSYGVPSAHATATNQQQPPVETFDESAFEAAFEQARADMAAQEMIATEEHAENVSEVAQLEETASAETQETIRIGSDTILERDKDDSQARLNDADELARTAGQLLDSVSHEQSQKFRESNFLALMRRIRDREVQIEGDEFRETSQSLHPGGKYYPDGGQQQIPKSLNLNITPGDINPIQETPLVQREFGSIDPREEPPKNTVDASLTRANLEDDNALYASWNYGGS